MNLSRLNALIVSIALPMIISNITTPLLGLVDSAIVGHLEHAYYLGAVAVGSMVVSFIFWLFGFLRMSSTGLIAQALGEQTQMGGNTDKAYHYLSQGIILASAIAFLIVLTKPWLIELALTWTDASKQVLEYAREYLSIRLYAAPAALINLVLMAWLIAHKQTSLIMWVQIIINLLNIVLDLIFVFGFNLKVEGVALASVLVQYAALILYARPILKDMPQGLLTSLIKQFQLSQLWQFISLNTDMFLRTLLLQLCFLFITFQGAKLGDGILAANAVLLNFLLLISLGLDGIAHASEVLIGHAYGAKKRLKLILVYKLSRNWNIAFALLYCLIFAIFGEFIIKLISDIPDVVETSKTYLVYVILLPLLACWCYLYDGVFIGLAQSKTMRNTMFVSVVGVFFPICYSLQSLGNHALWIALLTLMLARGITLRIKLSPFLKPSIPKQHQNAEFSGN